MPHIHNGPGEHDPTASAYIVRLDTTEPTLVLHKHKKLGIWLQFGGHVETDENPWQAIAHELLEESGYDISQLKVLQPKHRIKHMTGVDMHPIPIAPFTHKFPGLDHYHSDIGFGFTTHQEPAYNPGENESTEIECFTLDQLQQLRDSEVPPNLIEIGRFLLTDGIEFWEQVPSSEWTLESPSAHTE